MFVVDIGVGRSAAGRVISFSTGRYLRVQVVSVVRTPYHTAIYTSRYFLPILPVFKH